MSATLNRTRILSDSDLAMYFASVVDSGRFPSIKDKGLAIVGDDDHDEFYPESDVLADRGFCVSSMALALAGKRITPADLGDLVDDVTFGVTSVTRVNQMLYAMRPLTERRRVDFTSDVLEGMGFDPEAVFACLSGGVVSRKQVFDLVGRVCRGFTSVEHANTGLGCLAEQPAYHAYA